MPTPAQEIHLVARPRGEPVASDFRLLRTELADPAPGEVLIRNLVMSVDPYMRGRMNDIASYVPPWQLDQPADGGAVGQVIVSAVPTLPVGTLVLHAYGWRDLVVLPADRVRPIEPAVDVAPSRYLGVLGMPGLTAYVGLFTIAAFQAGDTVFVSAAAGAVGSLVGQLARLRGARRVIGSAGSAAKVRYLVDELGFDAAFDYHDGPVMDQLRKAAPEGIDVYFDNVGGDHLEAAIDVLKPHGRVAMCGSISVYNATERPVGPNNLALAIGKRLTLRGFIVTDHGGDHSAFVTAVEGWLRSGDLRAAETVVDGLDNAVAAFIGMLGGANTGKMIVHLADPA